MPALFLAVAAAGSIKPTMRVVLPARHSSPQTSLLGYKCTLLQADTDCTWSGSQCTPGQCMAINCGLSDCQCVRLPSYALPPWSILNVSSVSCPDEIKRAYLERQLALNSANEECPELALEEILIARRARDTMLELAPWLERSDCVGKTVSASRAKTNASVTSPEGLVRIAVKHVSKWVVKRVKQAASSAAGWWRKALARAYQLMSSPWAMAAELFIVGLLLLQALQGATICNGLLWKEAAKTGTASRKLSPLSILGRALLGP